LVYSLSSTQLAGEVESIRSWDDAHARIVANGEVLLQTGVADAPGQRVLTEVRTIDELGLSLEFSVSERALLGEFNRSILVLAGAVVITLLVSSPLVYLFAARHYRPVAQIEQFIERTFRVTPNERALASQVEQHVRSLLEERASLTDQIDASSDLVVRELLIKLFRGAIQPVDRLLQLCEEYGVKVEGRKFTVVMIAFAPVPSDLPSESIVDLVARHTAAECYGFLEHDADHFSLLLSQDRDIDGDDLPLALKGLVDDPLWATTGQIAMAVGSTVQGIDRISQSYVAARSALEHRHVHGMDEVFSFEEIYRDQRTRYEYPTAKLVRLEALVRSAQPAAVPALLADIFGVTRTQSPPLSVVRMVAFDCVNTLLREAAVALPEEQKELWELNDALRLARLQTLSQIEEHVMEMGERVCRLLGQGSDTRSLESFGMIVQFIAEHAFDPDFSANTVADFADKSLSSFSHHFRSHMGVTFRDHLNELRMGKALELLGETDLPVGEIVLAVGYSDATSFIRKFKRDHGMTPTEYRKRTHMRRESGAG
ncbi:MAG: helix-turn-helix domain-containing protein, partial [Spirochaetales bacterium]